MEQRRETPGAAQLHSTAHTSRVPLHERNSRGGWLRWHELANASGPAVGSSDQWRSETSSAAIIRATPRSGDASQALIIVHKRSADTTPWAF